LHQDIEEIENSSKSKKRKNNSKIENKPKKSKGFVLDEAIESHG
jgi:hypothetical protein